MRRWPLGMIVPMQDPTPFSPFRPQDWMEALDAVAAAGYDGVELAITDPKLLEAESIAEALETRGLRLLSITTGQAAGVEGLSLSCTDSDVRSRAIKRICEHMAFARIHNAVVIVGSLRGAEGDPRLLRESLDVCASFAPDVLMALEPLNRYESELLNTVGEAVDFVRTVGAPNLGVLFDTFHANIEEASLPLAIEATGDRLLHVHLADSNRWVPGYGHMDFELVWRALERIEYKHACVLEPMPKPDGSAVLAFARSLQERPTS